MAAATYSLPQLTYAYDVSPKNFEYHAPRLRFSLLTVSTKALEPSISRQIMELHHSKHHQTYVTNLNKALEGIRAAVEANDLDKQIALQSAINFNGGGHINHTLFWQNLTPASSPDAQLETAQGLMAEIASTWGGFENFKKAISATLLGIQGSGWGWLVKVEGTTQLQIVTTKDQDPVPNAFVPIFGVDMWEHAYYLQVSHGTATS